MAITSAEFETAIRAINTGGQEYTIGDRTFRRGDLATLRQLLRDAIATERASGKTMFQRVRFGSVSP
jgi:hypothetical protein